MTLSELLDKELDLLVSELEAGKVEIERLNEEIRSAREDALFWAKQFAKIVGKDI